MPPTTVSVKILDKEFQVACQPEEVDELTASACHLDKQMRTIRESGKVLGLDQIRPKNGRTGFWGETVHVCLKYRGACFR